MEGIGREEEEGGRTVGSNMIHKRRKKRRKAQHIRAQREGFSVNPSHRNQCIKGTANDIQKKLYCKKNKYIFSLATEAEFMILFLQLFVIQRKI